MTFRVKIKHAPFHKPIAGIETMEDCQRAYVELRDATGLGASGFGDGWVINEATGEAVARISYNGRLWPCEPWHSGMVPIAEAPH